MTANSKVVQFGSPSSGRRPTDTFYSLATKMLKDTLKNYPGHWWVIGASLFSESYPLEDIERLGYQQYGCIKCGSKELPHKVGCCPKCYEEKYPRASDTTEEKPGLQPLKYASWRAPKLPAHSDLIDVQMATYYSRLLVGPFGYSHNGLQVGGSGWLRGYKDGYRDATEPLSGFFICEQVTGVTKSYAQKDITEVAKVMELGAKKNLDALFQVRIEPDHEQEALTEIDHQLRFVDRVIQKGHLKGQVRAIYRHLERYQARRG